MQDNAGLYLGQTCSFSAPYPKPKPHQQLQLCHLNFEGIWHYWNQKWKKLQVLLPFCVPALEYSGGFVPKCAEPTKSPGFWFALQSYPVQPPSGNYMIQGVSMSPGYSLAPEQVRSLPQSINSAATQPPPAAYLRYGASEFSSPWGEFCHFARSRGISI